MISAAAALAVATPAMANRPAHESKVAAPAPTEPNADAATPKSQPDFGAIMAVFDKLFPPQPDPDPARLALARTSVQAMWPDGAYGKMMVGLFGGVFDRVMQLRQSDLGPLAGKTEKANRSASDVSIHQKALEKDPYFDQRMAAIRTVLNDEAAKASAIIDPHMREGLARAMARRFDARQLSDIDAFFATPTGQAFASQYMQLWVDPDMMRSVAATFPQVMALMPEAMQKIKAADEKYPRPPKAADAAKSPAPVSAVKKATPVKSAKKTRG